MGPTSTPELQACLHYRLLVYHHTSQSYVGRCEAFRKRLRETLVAIAAFRRSGSSRGRRDDLTSCVSDKETTLGSSRIKSRSVIYVYCRTGTRVSTPFLGRRALFSQSHSPAAHLLGQPHAAVSRSHTLCCEVFTKPLSACNMRSPQ
jgi:hypothetical protein